MYWLQTVTASQSVDRIPLDVGQAASKDDLQACNGPETIYNPELRPPGHSQAMFYRHTHPLSVTHDLGHAHWTSGPIW